MLSAGPRPRTGAAVLCEHDRRTGAHEQRIWPTLWGSDRSPHQKMPVRRDVVSGDTHGHSVRCLRRNREVDSVTPSGRSSRAAHRVVIGVECDRHALDLCQLQLIPCSGLVMSFAVIVSHKWLAAPAAYAVGAGLLNCSRQTFTENDGHARARRQEPFFSRQQTAMPIGATLGGRRPCLQALPPQRPAASSMRRRTDLRPMRDADGVDGGVYAVRWVSPTSRVEVRVALKGIVCFSTQSRATTRRPRSRTTPCRSGGCRGAPACPPRRHQSA